MSLLLVALHPNAGVGAARFAEVWNADRRARRAGNASVKQTDSEQFIPGMKLVEVQLRDKQEPHSIYKVLKDVLKQLADDSAKPPAALLSAAPTGDGDLFALIPAAPADGPRKVVFTAAVMFVCWLSRTCSPATWLGLTSREGFIQGYALFWLAGLSAILAIGPTTTAGWRWVMLAIVLFRLQELMFATLDNALNLTERARRQGNQAHDWPTPLLLALVSIIQVVLIFAIAYLVLIGQNPAAFANPPSSPFEAFFLSWISLPPLGGGATPLSTMAKVLTISEEATALLLVVIAIGRFLAGPD